MIKKISQIKNLGVFDDFLWDKCVIDENGNSIKFEKINIIYGRNYSGKTTVSRIFRTLETGISFDNNKYNNPVFSLEIDNGKAITQDNITDSNLPIIRVFNNDFIQDNLAFINNSDESIKPFAILGDNNKKIEEEINKLETELGSNEEGKETGLYAKLKNVSIKLEEFSSDSSEIDKNIEKKKKSFAIDQTYGIKYNFHLYGDQNYTVTKLDDDIKKVLLSTYLPIDDENKTILINSLKETQNATINPPQKIVLLYSEFCISTGKLITKKIGTSGKIPELIREITLNTWVKDGYNLHKDKRQICAFCNNEISNERWAELNRHFDEESKNLEIGMDLLIDQIKKHKTDVESIINIDEKYFYLKFHKDIIELKNEMKILVEKYGLCLQRLIDQLDKRKKEITVDFDLEKSDDISDSIYELLNRYEIKRNESNDYSDKLSAEQKATKEKLRLQKVYEFVTTSEYIESMEKKENLQQKIESKKQEVEKIYKFISEKEELIQNKKGQLNDEEKGAIKVNEYLTDYFGHEFLSLKAIKKDEEMGEKKIYFEIIRDGKQAFDLSEGECSLIAFCYFMAKLNDIETKGKRPIIWIDDPISSLDNNHIFFVYSLIRSEIVATNNFEQLYISTHNLNFLKYLKRFKKNADKKGYFIIYRQYRKAIIKMMPAYLIDYVTEFNFLFNEIYKCTLIEDENEDNQTLFYNFGNNARKFLEIYLYYKYPDNTKEIEKMEKFFGKGKIPPFLTDRINNEYSHLAGIFERAATPIEVPEMQKAANLIIETIEKEDKEQFCALLNSIGIKYDEYKKRKKQKMLMSEQNNIDLFTEEELIQNVDIKDNP